MVKSITLLIKIKSTKSSPFITVIQFKCTRFHKSRRQNFGDILVTLRRLKIILIQVKCYKNYWHFSLSPALTAPIPNFMYIPMVPESRNKPFMIQEHLSVSQYFHLQRPLDQPTHMSMYNSVGGGIGQAGWSSSWTWTNLDNHTTEGSLTRLLLLEYMFSTVLTVGAVLRMQPWESKVLLRPSGLYMWLNPIKTSIWTLKIQVGRCRDLLISQPPKTSLISDFPRSLKQAPIKVVCLFL